MPPSRPVDSFGRVRLRLGVVPKRRPSINHRIAARGDSDTCWVLMRCWVWVQAQVLAALVPTCLISEDLIHAVIRCKRQVLIIRAVQSIEGEKVNRVYWVKPVTQEPKIVSIIGAFVDPDESGGGLCLCISHSRIGL